MAAKVSEEHIHVINLIAQYNIMENEQNNICGGQDSVDISDIKILDYIKTILEDVNIYNKVEFDVITNSDLIILKADLDDIKEMNMRYEKSLSNTSVIENIIDYFKHCQKYMDDEGHSICAKYYGVFSYKYSKPSKEINIEKKIAVEKPTIVTNVNNIMAEILKKDADVYRIYNLKLVGECISMLKQLAIINNPGYVQLKIDYNTIKEEKENLEQQNHVPGSFKDRADPAKPPHLGDRHSLTYGALRNYVNSLIKSLRGAGRLDEFIPRFVEHATCGLMEHSLYELPSQDYFNQAIIAASMSVELFRYFESETFDYTSTVIPTSVVFEARVARRKLMKDRHDKILRTRLSELEESKEGFGPWIGALRTRLHHIWLQVAIKGTDIHDEWSKLFEVKGADTGSHFLKVCMEVWALHKLKMAYPYEPELIRFAPGEPLKDRVKLIGSYFNKDDCEDRDVELPSNTALEEYSVYCTVFPGYVLDDVVTRCDVLWCLRLTSVPVPD